MDGVTPQQGAEAVASDLRCDVHRWASRNATGPCVFTGEYWCIPCRAYRAIRDLLDLVAGQAQQIATLTQERVEAAERERDDAREEVADGSLPNTRIRQDSDGAVSSDADLKLPTGNKLYSRRALAEVAVTQTARVVDLHQQIATLRQALTETQKALAITKLAAPLEDELSDRIDEVCKQLAMEDGFTLAGIARLLTDCQRRMAADWDVIGSERRERQAAEARVRALEAERDAAIRVNSEGYRHELARAEQAEAALARVQELEQELEAAHATYSATNQQLAGDLSGARAKYEAAEAALADLRSRLRELVAQWRITEPAMGKYGGAIVKCCADELAALIPPETP